MKDHLKLLFEYEGTTPDVREIESMWAVPVEGGYKIDNIPFYAREVALGDVVSAEKDADGMLRFKALVQPSGHSTVRLWFAKGREHEVRRIRERLREMGCPSELSDLSRLVAVDVPPQVPYEQVREFLDEGEKTGLFEYEEACLGS
jgi:hypothetical protein